MVTIGEHKMLCIYLIVLKIINLEVHIVKLYDF